MSPRLTKLAVTRLCLAHKNRWPSAVRNRKPVSKNSCPDQHERHRISSAPTATNNNRIFSHIRSICPPGTSYPEPQCYVAGPTCPWALQGRGECCWWSLWRLVSWSQRCLGSKCWVFGRSLWAARQQKRLDCRGRDEEKLGLGMIVVVVQLMGERSGGLCIFGWRGKYMPPFWGLCEGIISFGYRGSRDLFLGEKRYRLALSGHFASMTTNIGVNWAKAIFAT